MKRLSTAPWLDFHQDLALIYSVNEKEAYRIWIDWDNAFSLGLRVHVHSHADPELIYIAPDLNAYLRHLIPKDTYLDKFKATLLTDQEIATLGKALSAFDPNFELIPKSM